MIAAQYFVFFVFFVLFVLFVVQSDAFSAPPRAKALSRSSAHERSPERERFSLPQGKTQGKIKSGRKL
jgi:hypothetical protein